MRSDPRLSNHVQPPDIGSMLGHRLVMDRKIVHVPLGQLSPVTLKRLRVFHVLSDRAARASARTFIRD